MAAVLGVSGLYHDAAAALVVDGKIIAAIQEERLSRRKGDPSLPRLAASACLARAGISARALDAVVFYENPYTKLERVMSSLLGGYPRAWRQFAPALAAQLGSKLWVLDELAEMLDVPRRRVRFVEHHESHAASAFFASPFSRAAVLTVDGVGEEISTAMWCGDETGLHCLDRLHFPQSLGLFYAALTAYLGFAVNDGEYKVMGLAAHGRPELRAEMDRLIRLDRDGSFELDLSYFAHTTDSDLGFSPRLEKLLGPRRHPGRPWNLAGDAADRRYADVAASLQSVTEDALVGLARAVRDRTGADVLCLAGGVALNAVANARLLTDAGFNRVFVPPAAGDAGGALGAALLVSRQLGDPRPEPLTSAALGDLPSTADAYHLATELGFSPRRIDDVPAAVAQHLAAGRVVALCTGRFEWGPRALGHRSLLALPNDPAIRERLNRVVKRREPFRPFAPAVTAGEAQRFFEGAPNDMTPFMTTVCRVRPEVAGELAAVTHVDGTARVQTVTEASAPDFFALLGEVKRLTGIPIVLNTSLNGPDEPIVADALDAVAFHAKSSVDVTVIGDVFLERTP